MESHTSPSHPVTTVGFPGTVSSFPPSSGPKSSNIYSPSSSGCISYSCSPCCRAPGWLWGRGCGAGRAGRPWEPALARAHRAAQPGVGAGSSQHPLLRAESRKARGCHAGSTRGQSCNSLSPLAATISPPRSLVLQFGPQPFLVPITLFSSLFVSPPTPHFL